MTSLIVGLGNPGNGEPAREDVFETEDLLMQKANKVEKDAHP